MNTWNKRLRDTWPLKFKSLAALSRASEVSRDSLQKYVKDGVNQPRGDTLEKIATALDIDHLWLKEGVSKEQLENFDHNYARIAGYVQAGLWGEANDLSVRDEDVMLANPKYPTAFGLIVKGDSMNKKWQEGAKILCVPILDYDEEIKSGKSVIVEAVCMADEKETTVKDFYTDDQGNHWLIPHSTNPTYQNYPVPNGEDLDININGRKIKEINITAIVVGVFQEV